MVNSGVLRSDAVIIDRDGAATVMGLEQLTVTDVRARADDLLELSDDHGTLTGALRRRRVIPDVLGWLWDTAVEPVLGAVPDWEPKPRIWWLPIGLLGLFPLHAAGHPDRSGALDRIVSSYAPTMRAVTGAHARPGADVRRQLTVALPRTPGLADLPHCAREATVLRGAQPDALQLSGDGATAARVRAALAEATWVHFACHASADATNPSRGGLRLHDGVLPIPEINRLRLEHAELAYLSACSTAHRDTRLADESVNLASAFQLAGFRHVIASLWPLYDRTAADAAQAFYARMPSVTDADDAARALHQVTCDLRTAQPERADLWAALVHSGA